MDVFVLFEPVLFGRADQYKRDMGHLLSEAFQSLIIEPIVDRSNVDGNRFGDVFQLGRHWGGLGKMGERHPIREMNGADALTPHRIDEGLSGADDEIDFFDELFFEIEKRGGRFFKAGVLVGDPEDCFTGFDFVDPKRLDGRVKIEDVDFVKPVLSDPLQSRGERESVPMAEDPFRAKPRDGVGRKQSQWDIGPETPLFKASRSIDLKAALQLFGASQKMEGGDRIGKIGDFVAEFNKLARQMVAADLKDRRPWIRASHENFFRSHAEKDSTIGRFMV